MNARVPMTARPVLLVAASALAATLVSHYSTPALAPSAANVARESEALRGSDEGAASAQGERVTLGPDGAARAGIRTTRAKAASAVDEVEGFGRVLDPLPLIEALGARAAARSAAALAQTEYTRVDRLHRADQNASTRDLDGARAALERANVDLASAEARVALSWGAAFDADTPSVADLAAGHSAIVRIDLPAGEHLATMPVAATIVPVAWPQRRLKAHMLAPARSTDPVLQGDAYLAMLNDMPPAPGTSMVAYVARAEARRTGVAVPASAVLWADGRAVVYVEVSPGVFERRPVAVVRSRRGVWLATDGLAPGERVATRGAARLLSAETLRAQPSESE